MMKQALPCLFSEFSPRPLLQAVKNALSQKTLNWIENTSTNVESTVKRCNSQSTNNLRQIQLQKNLDKFKILSWFTRNIINQAAHSFLTDLAVLLTILSLVPLNQLLTSSVFSLSLSLSTYTR